MQGEHLRAARFMKACEAFAEAHGGRWPSGVRELVEWSGWSRATVYKDFAAWRRVG